MIKIFKIKIFKAKKQHLIPIFLIFLKLNSKSE